MSTVSERMQNLVAARVPSDVACRDCVHATWFQVREIDMRDPQRPRGISSLAAFCKALNQSPYDSKEGREVLLCSDHQPIPAPEPQA